jgi:molybdopterin molybdotransferase
MAMTQFEKRTPDWLSASDAVDQVLSRATPLEEESVPIPESLGRALAKGVLARAPLPPWDNSAMDGYAIRGRDVSGATRQSPVMLQVVGETRAGEVAGRALGKGEAIRIMTGAPIPPGADSVIRVEDTDAEGTPGKVKIFADGDVGRHIRPGGQDMQAGQVLLPPQTTIGPGQLGLLYASGSTAVEVHRRPRVAVLSNGNELAAPGDFQKVLSGRGIPETNSPTLAAELSMAGAEPIRLGIARDNAQDILDRVERAREEGADALITSGGASMGEMDLFKRVLVDAGLELDFWRVKIRPGTPFSFGFLNTPGRKPLPVFGLPGNPASSFVTYQIFCRPFILRMAGHRRVHRPVIMATAGEELVSPVHLTHFFRVNLRGGEGNPNAFLTGPQTSGLIQSQGLAQGLAVVPEGTRAVQKGHPVKVILLDNMGLGGPEAGYFGD